MCFFIVVQCFLYFFSLGDPCTKENKNGGCDHKCEPLGGTKYRCSCNEGYKLNGTRQCISKFY